MAKLLFKGFKVNNIKRVKNNIYKIKYFFKA